MSADTFDPILGLLLMGTGNDGNSWGNNANVSVFSPTARAIAGVNTITSTGGTVDLSGTVPPAGLRADIDHIQLLNGLLTSDVTVKVPNVSKTWWFENDTTGSFNVFLQVPGGVSPNGLVQIPQGLGVFVACDGNGKLRRHDRAEVGSFRISAKGSAGAGELVCNGASLLRTAFPDLFNAIGTTWGSVDSVHFTLPLLTDTNRYLRAGGGSGPAVGTYQSSQNAAHTHSVTGAPAVGTLTTDSQGAHTHSATPNEGSGHSHGVSGGTRGAPPVGSIGLVGQGGADFPFQNIVINNATTGMSITIGSAGAHTHNVTGTLTVGTLGTASQGGTEARPESAAVLICIRY
jgi:microcystin-dependent protein